MACEGNYDTNSLQPWARVPGGSTLTVSIETDGTGVQAGARVVIDRPHEPTHEQVWTDADLRPGPKALPLAAGESYAVRVRVGFQAGEEEEAVIAAEITKPDGSRHGLPYRFCVHGTKGDAKRSTITVATRSA
jgi:hypothetical protein